MLVLWKNSIGGSEDASDTETDDSDTDSDDTDEAE